MWSSEKQKKETERSIEEMVVEGKGSFQGQFAPVDFEAMGLNASQELWLIREHNYEPGNPGNLGASDILKLARVLCERGTVSFDILPGYHGSSGEAIVSLVYSK
jgi:hypothetical protein